MQTKILQLRRILPAALVAVTSFVGASGAAEYVINDGSYRPALRQPANTSGLQVAQITAQQNPAASAVQPSAQPGQSTIPPATSSPTNATPALGAQPGQSTIQSPTSTAPGTTPALGAPNNGLAPGQGFAPGGATAVPGGAVPVIPPQSVVVPRTQIAPQTQIVVPPQTQQYVSPPNEVYVPQGEETLPLEDSSRNPQASPFVDENGEEIPIDSCQGNGGQCHVRPYGGGHPYDWSWGCGGSPYRTIGMCDDWRVGPRWHMTIDGMVLSREDVDLEAIQGAMQGQIVVTPGNPNYPLNVNGIDNNGPPTLEQMEKEGGARISFMSQVGQCTNWDVQFVYEGVPEWNSSIVYPVQLFNLDYPLDPTPAPPAPFPQGTVQRSLHYTTSLHSAELNAIPLCNKTWRPVFGFRYFHFNDEINDSINAEAQPPLAGPALAVDVNGGIPPVNPQFLPIGPSWTTDRVNIYDIQNNLMGFQVGLLHDTWQVNNRFAFEGVVSAGVYYNRIKYTNYRGIFTTQVYSDNTNSTTFDESRVDFSDVVNNDVREYSEIAYHGEASLTGVCRLNKCWSLRGGYQVLWLGNVHTAEDAYLGQENVNDDLLFHGWHAGIECRR